MTAWKLLGITCIVAPLTASASIFFTDFELDAVGATTAAGQVGGFFADRPGGIVRDSSTVAPFGPDNQYLEFSGVNSRAIVSAATVSDFAGALVEVSVDFFDAGTGTAGFGTRFGLGTGEFPDTPDLNAPGSLFSIRFRTSDQTVNIDANTSVVSGSIGGYSVETAYRVQYIFNLTSEDQVVSTLDGNSVSLEPMQAAFGMQELATGNFSNIAVLASSGTVNTHIGLVFRNFSGDETIAYYDNLSVIPEPTTYAAIFGLAALSLLLVRRRLSARADR